MKVAIVRIGNSRGVRLPKAVLDQAGFDAAADLTVEDGRIVLTPVDAPRRGWAEAFAGDPAGDLGEDDIAWLESSLADEDT
jgi:antitoxin MazE